MTTFEEVKQKFEKEETKQEALELFGLELVTSLCVNCKHYFNCPVRISSVNSVGACINRCSYFVAPIEAPKD